MDVMKDRAKGQEEEEQREEDSRSLTTGGGVTGEFDLRLEKNYGSETSMFVFFSLKLKLK